MKIIIIGPAFPLRGGIADFNEALCRSFRAQGHDASIISFTLQYPGFLFPGTTQQHEAGTSAPDIPITAMINSVNPLTWYATARHIAAQKPDLVIIRYWLPFMAPALGTIARGVRRRSKARVVAICDNVVPHESRPGDKALTKYFVNSCQGFVVMAEAVARDLNIFDTNKPRIVSPHPLYDIFGAHESREEALRALSLDPTVRYLLFFGFIRKYKGLDLLLQALADPRLQEHNYKLIVAGEFYDEPESYHTLIKELGIADRVLLHTQFISRDNVRHYFCAADLVVQPYRSATQSGVTQIAYNFDIPMLVTNVGGLADMVPHNLAGYVTQPEPTAIADALEDFMLHHRLDDMKEAVAKEKHRFSWERMTANLIDLGEVISKN